eukprot:GHVH01006515.1.p1 GENE.GHVH01006515.1~~GHVH01006515.1.p1  ORF type:complete len:499 (+),score=63.65 GHVH01006515.1:99-1595(+)
MSNKRGRIEQMSLQSNDAEPKVAVERSKKDPKPGYSQEFTARRARQLRGASPQAEGQLVVYWMTREVRTRDNFALHHAQSIALGRNVPLIVYYSPIHTPYPNRRQYDWRVKGLVDVQESLETLNVSLVCETDEDWTVLRNLANHHKISHLVTDFFPLRQIKDFHNAVTKFLPSTTSFEEVDSHNVIPAWVVSSTHETYAYMLRKKQNEMMLNSFKLRHLPPPIEKHPFPFTSSSELDPKSLLSSASDVLALLTWDIPPNKVHPEVEPIEWAEPGQTEAYKRLDDWVEKGIKGYASNRMNPLAKSLSNFSIYFNHGFLSPQRALLAVQSSGKIAKEDKESFISEALVWREMSDNFTLYEPNYDNFDGLRQWAQVTLSLHDKDERAYCYSLEEFEKAETHDLMWNTAQRELICTGKIHGYIRIYWAKKILHWSSSSREALRLALYLNDKWALDGTDPGSYNGIMWSIGGMHDQGWGEREIFGKIRSNTLGGDKETPTISF